MNPYQVVRWTKSYHALTEDLLEETYYIDPYNRFDLRNARVLTPVSFARQLVTTATQYNFMGNPLRKTMTEQSQTAMPNVVTSTQRTKTAFYSYWGADKYFQQKAAVDHLDSATNPANWRLSYTDFFNDQAAQGSKGQTSAVFSSAFSGFTLDTQIPVPAGTPTSNEWRYRLVPTSGNATAMFSYDSKGRPELVQKLRSNALGTYVKTFTEYGADQSPEWGQAKKVYEDYQGTNQRLTETLAYDSAGRAEQVKDSKGQVFLTDYDDDGMVLSMTRTDNGTNPVVTYAYGSSGLTNGVVTSVTDGPTGQVQYFTYWEDGTGKGQIKTVWNSGVTTSGTDYTVKCWYGPWGDRERVLYDTPETDTYWGYYDYVTAGDPASGARAFQTMRRVTVSGETVTPTAEEFHYQFDSAGRLSNAAFAQTPADGYTPTGTNPWYDADHKAKVRARAYYEYDSAGRMTSIEHWWDTWSQSGYTSQAIIGENCSYETTSLSRGLKLTSAPKHQDENNPASFVNDHTYPATYSYHGQRDFLVGVDYNDGQPSEVQAWSYDDSGNRTTGSAQYDSLNRITADGTYTYQHDVLGNRTLRMKTSNSTTTTYAWDAANRMVGYQGREYTYRADGMRVRTKLNNASSLYRYHGQMGFQDVARSGSTLQTLGSVTNSALGDRGIDFIERLDASLQVISGEFPLYDSHGSMVATLSRNGTGFSLANVRSYGAWGEIRKGTTTGAPSGRYVASIGHRQDDESDLIFMRARYYEPGRGRFLSEDRQRDGANWFSYCHNCPVSLVDPSGNVGLADIISGGADEVYEKFAEAQQSKVTLSWAEQQICKALGKWSEKVGPELLEAMWGEEYLLAMRVGAGGFGIQLTGVHGRYGMGIVVQAEELVVKTYNSFGDHIWPNIYPWR